MAFNLLTRKATGFKSKRVNCWEINQIKLKCQMDFKLAILNFWTKSTQKGYFRSKERKKKKKNENRHLVLHIRISLGSKFHQH